MDVRLVSSITKLANYMPLGSYVIYTALETYSFSLGETPAPITTIVETPTLNYTCLYVPGAAFTYTTCSSDQSSALIISLSIGFFLAMFLSFLKQVPNNGTPPLADPPEDDGVSGTSGTAAVGGVKMQRKGVRKPEKRKYRRGIVYVEGNFYYLDFGDSHVWGHAALSFVAFGTLSLFSASVSQCLFPSIKPWIFVFTQIILLVICCFIAMFWIDDPSLSIGLMVVPQTDTTTQTSNGNISNVGSGGGGTGQIPNPSNNTSTPTSTAPATAAAAVATYNASTSTTALPATGYVVSPNQSATSAGLANVALANTVMNSAMGMTSTSGFSTASTAVAGGGGGGGGPGSGTGVGTGGVVNRSSLVKGRAPTMSSVNEKQDQDLLDDIDRDVRAWETQRHLDEARVEVYMQAEAIDSASSSSDSIGHLSLKME